LSQNVPVIPGTIVTIKELSNEERIRQQRERHEKYERDRINAMNYSYREGYKAGFSEGVEQAKVLLAQLHQKLLENNRGSEITKALSDADYRNKLFKEFELL